MSITDSETGDERLKLIIEATDTNFLNDSIYSKIDKSINSTVLEKNSGKLNSERYLENTEILESDLKVTESMQSFVGKKLSKMIENKYEFIEYLNNNKKVNSNTENVNNVRLLSDSISPISYCNKLNEVLPMNQKRPMIRRKVIEADKLSKREKLIAASIDYDFIKNETKQWSNRPKGSVFFYKGKSKDSKLVLASASLSRKDR